MSFTMLVVTARHPTRAASVVISPDKHKMAVITKLSSWLVLRLLKNDDKMPPQKQVLKWCASWVWALVGGLFTVVVFLCPSQCERVWWSSSHSLLPFKHTVHEPQLKIPAVTHQATHSLPIYQLPFPAPPLFFTFSSPSVHHLQEDSGFFVD